MCIESDDEEILKRKLYTLRDLIHHTRCQINKIVGQLGAKVEIIETELVVSEWI